jgi:hypothetical protein
MCEKEQEKEASYKSLIICNQIYVSPPRFLKNKEERGREKGEKRDYFLIKYILNNIVINKYIPALLLVSC